ncbi:MAG: transcription elongation factor GreA [Flammeovirgaceae bacterium]|nr:transcription elongation factor GreA [Flammeovirgaceae bacterium]|tara:strand:- start:225 stop:698 length:474 start_codon:yes stop_codon:yes gene_type:complete
MSTVKYFTEEGLKKLKDELNLLKTKGRAEIASQIAEARDKGDLSENAEYDAAKEAQGLHELKISKLEESISNARVIDESEINTDKVSILSKVQVLNLSFNKEFEYTIVSEEESDLQLGKISVQSPIGKGLLGKKKGEEVSIDVPSGELKFKILNISL